MDWIYNIVDAASSLMKEHMLVLHRNMKQNTKFKVYKKFSYTLYLVRSKNDKETVLTYENNMNCPSDDIEKCWSKCDNEFILKLVNWLSSDDYIKMKYGVQ